MSDCGYMNGEVNTGSNNGSDPFASCVDVLHSIHPKSMCHRVIISVVLLKLRATEAHHFEDECTEKCCGGSRGDGETEGEADEVKTLMRSIKIDLEHKFGSRIERSHPILSGLPTYVSDVISRHREVIDWNISAFS